ncbi:MAG: single-stranded DNA-binding protein [Fibrobacter sp.]|nr:single-stranded DNA-binding protein [Fibrobacter sp.]
MNDLNSVSLVGRLTKDLDVRYTSGGMAVGNFALAVNKRIKRNEQYVDEVSFFDCTCFGKTAENLKPYLLKGKQVAMFGSLKQERWKDDNGNNRSKISVIADMIQLIGGNNADGGTEHKNETQFKPKQNVIAPNNESFDGDGDFPEDIPF